MRRLVMFVVCAGCGAQPQPPLSATAVPPPANGLDPVVGELDTIRSRMCACLDEGCAGKVSDQHKVWLRVHKRLAAAEDDTATDAQVGRTVRLEAAYKTCNKKFGPGLVLKRMVEFTDMMCKCADKACADQVTDAMTKWSIEMAKTADRDLQVSEEDTKKMQEVTEEFTKCATKAMTAGIGP